MTEACLVLYIYIYIGMQTREGERIVASGFDRVFLDELTPGLITVDPPPHSGQRKRTLIYLVIV